MVQKITTELVLEFVPDMPLPSLVDGPGERVQRESDDRRMATNTDTITLDGAAEFVRQFREVWERPSVQRLDELTHNDVEYIQPLHRTITGRATAADFWRQMFVMIPDLRAEVLNWAHGEGAVYIEFRMSGTIAGNPIAWEAVDRYRLEDGKVRQRIAYFDPLPLAGKVARRPRSLFAFIRFGVRQALGRYAK